MSYELLKSLHIIGFVCWFAGLFYIVRLFIYHVEAISNKSSSELTEQFKIMERRLWYGITWPSLVVTIVFGFSLAFTTGFIEDSWLHVKILLVMGLVIYHLYCGKLLKALKENRVLLSSGKLRILNEVATLFLVSIVFLAIYKSSLEMLYAVAGLIVFTFVLMAAIKAYKKIRLRS
ncbi:MAG: CopD family protein [Bacteriovoracaceae bacterium]|jgi:protoporphyrinogen IX oxidase|nr:CopD family protein [Bacteriovoracaceae bacterium]